CPVKKLDRLVYDNILLTGDAAGLVSPLHAGGIDSACISGKLAIQSIIEQKVHTFEKLVDSVLLRKIKADQKLYDLWQAIGFKHLENATDIVVTNPGMNIDLILV
ncbi:MAG TPA: hypothetical protein VHS59_10425, partial [Bacillota bacterium]|nr:hypothetical protein [Bacillota bacterium]